MSVLFIKINFSQRNKVKVVLKLALDPTALMENLRKTSECHTKTWIYRILQYLWDIYVSIYRLLIDLFIKLEVV